MVQNYYEQEKDEEERNKENYYEDIIEVEEDLDY